ncbi:hypothetical protein EGW08_013904 [Elysia chlorotica]|uniref:Uncharacterized protein n=1 Tax=Elysia chlorotica TaxID=188477 RepID=A0A3S1BYN1_ELYCH|nr:hypothetical protein EGW08_013904 [Elysia chlorotica]
MQMGAYDLMPRKTAAVYRSSETLVSTSSESDVGRDSMDSLTASSSGCPSPQPGSGRSESNLSGQHRTMTRRRASLDQSWKSNSPLQKSTEGGEAYGDDDTTVSFMLKRRLQDKLFADLSGSFSGDRRLSEGGALALRGLERSRSGDFYKNLGQFRRNASSNGLITAKLRPCFSEGVKISSGRTAFSFLQNSQASSSNSLGKGNNGLHGSLSFQHKQALRHSRSNHLLASNEALEDGCRSKRYRSHSIDSFESGDLRHGKRFLQGLQSYSRELRANISEEELTLSNVFQVRKLC